MQTFFWSLWESVLRRGFRELSLTCACVLVFTSRWGDRQVIFFFQKVTVVVALLFRKLMVWMLERIFLWCPARVTPMCSRSLKRRKKKNRNGDV